MYREKKGKSRAAMERETGISAATIYHYEIDGMEPTASRIIWLADYFNITSDELLRRDQLRNANNGHTSGGCLFVGGKPRETRKK